MSGGAAAGACQADGAAKSRRQLLNRLAAWRPASVGVGLRYASCAFALFAGLGLSGCATLDHGTLDEVPVVTDPPGATVDSSTGTLCRSPCTVSGPRRDSFVLTISKPGFATQQVTSEAKPADAAIAAASEPTVSADLLGRIVDVQDGSYVTHVPKAVVVKLVPDS